jgi:hypothetical protein
VFFDETLPRLKLAFKKSGLSGVLFELGASPGLVRFGQKLEELGAAIRKFFDEDLPKLREIFGKEGLRGVLREIGVPKGVLDFLDSLELSLTNLNTFWEQHGEEILEIFTRLADSFGKTVSAITGTTGQTLGELMEDFTGNLVENGDEVVKSMDGIATTIEKKFFPALENLGTFFRDNPDLLKGFGELVVFWDLLVKVGQALAPVFIIIGVARRRIETAVWGITGFIFLAIGLILKGLRQFFTDVGTALTNLFGVALTILAQILIVIARIVTLVFTAILNFFATIIPNLETKFAEIITAIENIDWWQLGVDIVDGIIAGIEDNQGLIATLVAMARNALNAVLEFFGQAPIGGGGGGGGQRKTKTGGGGMFGKALPDTIPLSMPASMGSQPVRPAISTTTISTVQNFNLVVNSSAPIEPVVADFRILESLGSGV